jgi:hypothetical protein
LREGEGQRGSGGGEAAAGEVGSEFFEGAVGAFAGGVFGKAEFLRDGGECLVFEEAEEDGGAVAFAEVVEGGVELGAEFFPVGGGLRVGGGRVHVGIEGVGGEFAGAAALLAPDEVGGGVARGGVEPGVDGGVAGERGGFLRGSGEDVLGDFLGAVGIPGDATQGGRVHEGEMAAHELAEGFFGAGVGVASQQGGVVWGEIVYVIGGGGHGGGSGYRPSRTREADKESGVFIFRRGRRARGSRILWRGRVSLRRGRGAGRRARLAWR